MSKVELNKSICDKRELKNTIPGLIFSQVNKNVIFVFGLFLLLLF